MKNFWRMKSNIAINISHLIGDIQPNIQDVQNLKIFIEEILKIAKNDGKKI